jgi:acyl-CoA reductase-like NAD-dependent aldehyde dehydrogenase
MRAQKKSARLAAVERGKYLGEVAEKICDRTDFLARIITERTGKPLGTSPQS